MQLRHRSRRSIGPTAKRAFISAALRQPSRSRWQTRHIPRLVEKASRTPDPSAPNFLAARRIAGQTRVRFAEAKRGSIRNKTGREASYGGRRRFRFFILYYIYCRKLLIGMAGGVEYLPFLRSLARRAYLKESLPRRGGRSTWNVPAPGQSAGPKLQPKTCETAITRTAHDAD